MLVPLAGSCAAPQLLCRVRCVRPVRQKQRVPPRIELDFRLVQTISDVTSTDEIV